MTDDKTVYDGSETVPEADSTVYDGSETMPETDSTVYEGSAPDETAEATATGGDIRRGGVLLDTYRVESDAFEGGMGAVWRVHHQNWNVDLAMKRPKPDFFVTQKQKDDFTRECESWINLGLHPNIVSCYYVRELGGVPTIFSEWMENGSVESRIKDESLYSGTDAEVRERLLDIAIQFARGLHYAHENGLIHQDVKPDNLLVTNNWDAKVSDFGLAKARSLLTVLEGDWTVREDDPGATQMSPSGGRTPAYCSPEQAANQLLTRRTDIYSWAVSVLELYMGCKPWAHGRELTGPMVSSACRDYFEMCRVPMPERLKDLLARCMAQDPEDRYRDFHKVEVALKEIYREEFDKEYPRPEPQAAADTADSLNNCALSYLDLGKVKEASQLWAQASRTDNSNFRCHYNLAVALWKSNRISAEALYKSVMEHREDTPEWEAASKAVSFAKVRTESDVRWQLAEKDATTVPSVLREPFYEISRKRYDHDYKLDDGDVVMDQSADGRRTIGADAASKQYLLLDEHGDTFRFQTYRRWKDDPEVREYHADRDRIRTLWFVDASGGIVTTDGAEIDFFNAKTGRSLLSIHPKLDYEGDAIFQHVTQFSANGFVRVEELSKRGEWYQLPPADPKVDYLLSRVESFSQRDDAMRRLLRDFPEAEKRFEDGDYAETLALLAPACEDGTLLQAEAALELWEKLFPYCEPGKLVTVLPSDALWRPLADSETNAAEPAVPGKEWSLDEADDGKTIVTAIEDYTMSENYNGGMDYDFTYALRANDVKSGQAFFDVDRLIGDSQSDDRAIDYGIFLKLSGQYLWYRKKNWTQEWCVNLGDPAFQRKRGLRLALPGTGDYFLKNTDGGVEIGGFAFDDEFRGLMPLWDAQVIQCRDKAYRLIYQYTGLRQEAAQ